MVVSALVDQDSDGDGIPNSQDNDDDNDGAPDSRDAPHRSANSSTRIAMALEIMPIAMTTETGRLMPKISAGLNPLAADSDGDSIPDEEIELGLDPFGWGVPQLVLHHEPLLALARRKLRSDRDGDGLSFERESALGTDPNRADSDGDGVADGEEVAKGYNPLRADSDLDGLSDGGSELWVRSAGGGYGR